MHTINDKMTQKMTYPPLIHKVIHKGGIGKTVINSFIHIIHRNILNMHITCG